MSKWAELKCVKIAPNRWEMEFYDDISAQWFTNRMINRRVGFKETFQAIQAETGLKGELNARGFIFEHEDPIVRIEDYEKGGAWVESDFRLKAKNGTEISLDSKACPHYGKYTIIQGDKVKADHYIGIRVFENSIIDFLGYAPRKWVLDNWPVYPVAPVESGGHEAITKKRGRPIPVNRLLDIDKLWSILKHECIVR